MKFPIIHQFDRLHGPASRQIQETTTPNGICISRVAQSRSPGGSEDDGLARTRPAHEPITCFCKFPTSLIKAIRQQYGHVPSSCIIKLLQPCIAVGGVIPLAALPLYPHLCDEAGTMAPASHMPVPRTPRVISATPTPSGSHDGTDGYFGPVTRSAARKKLASPSLMDEEVKQNGSLDSDLDFDRARTRSRSPILEARRRRMSGLTSAKADGGSASGALSSKRKKQADSITANGAASNGHLSPSFAGFSWRDISRSPSPLGLIPIHRHWRSLIHRHEIPRKVLHVSIGFIAVYLYSNGVRTTTISPWLMAALIPIFSVDYLRHRFPGLNRLYIRICGALMRESEVDGWNGTIWYLLGAWIVLTWFPKDVGVLGVMLLSWCDTAASTFGRIYGRYTPRLRRGKSLAGTLAAYVVGVCTAAFFWGWLAPTMAPFIDDPDGTFMFTGRLSLPVAVKKALGWGLDQGTLGGPLALGVMSLWTGLVGAASEVVDLWGWDDNLTIPVLSGLGLWGFLRIFG